MMSGNAPSRTGLDADEPGAGGGPRYCPRCVRETRAGATLCDECGDTPQPQGYCPVCERFWRRPVGDLCPKHDVPLDSAPLRPPACDLPGGPETSWITVRTFPDALAAEGARLRLEAEGIPTFVEGARMGSRSMYQVATGGVKLQVPESLAADARILLAQTWAPVAPDDDLDDAWEELAPEPGAELFPVIEATIGIILLALVALGLVVWLARP